MYENFNYGDETQFLQKRTARGKGIRHKWYRADEDEQHMRNEKLTSLNFEKYAAEGHRFVNEVAYELGVNPNMAARITRAVLHALRDRMKPGDAIQFAQGLPMALKGVYIDRYDLSDAPVTIRNVNEFLAYVRSRNPNTAATDFPDPKSVIDGLRGVFRVLERTMDPGQVEQVRHIMNRELVKLIDG